MSFNWTVNFLGLEDDIFLILFEFIPLSSLASLCRTCCRLHALVNEIGWATHLKLNRRTCRSLSSARSTWSSYESLKYDNLTDRAWSECSFIARPLSSPWQKRCVPAFAISNHRIVYAAGRDLYFYAFTPSQSEGLAPGLQFEAKLAVQDPRLGNNMVRRNNITGLAFMPDGSSLVASFEDGSVTKIPVPDTLPSNSSRYHDETSIKPLPAEPLYKAKHAITCLSARSCLSLTFSIRGEATLYDLSSGISSKLVLGFQRSGGWSAYLSASSPRYTALGTNEHAPLRIHPIFESDLSAVPSLSLGGENSDTADHDDAYIGHRRPNNAVLAISDPPPHFGSSGQVLVSGWMDGVVRIYDLRSDRRSSTSKITSVDGGSTTVPTLSPVMSIYEKTSRGIGTITCGGGAGCYVAASSLMDSLISFWDVRSPTKVWSVHAPVTKDPSPVYALGMESSRLFGATLSRPFIHDFGPGLTTNTYPAVETNEADGLQLQSDGIGYCIQRRLSTLQ